MIFHYKSSILGHPQYRKPPYQQPCQTCRKGFQGACTSEVFEALRETFGCRFECFASCLVRSGALEADFQNTWNMHRIICRFCSSCRSLGGCLFTLCFLGFQMFLARTTSTPEKVLNKSRPLNCHYRWSLACNLLSCIFLQGFGKP